MSDTGRITGGSASYMRRKNLGNYEHIEASASLTFVTPDDGDCQGTLATAAGVVQAHVHQQLGMAPPAPVAPAAPAKPPAHRKSANLDAQASVTKGADPTGQPAASPSAPTAATGAGSEIDDDPLGETTAPSGTPSHVAASGNQNAISSPASATTSSGAGVTDMPDDEIVATQEVTDADLGTATAKKNGALIAVHKEAGTQMIKDLVGKYVQPGKFLRDIPQGQRQSFLKALEGLA